MKRYKISGVICAIVGLVSGASAQDTQTAANVMCKESTASKVIHITVCSGAPSNDDLALYAREICDGNLACGVWFWAKAEDAPEVAPENHDGLTAEQVQSALGVYAAEQDTLIRISREPN